MKRIARIAGSLVMLVLIIAPASRAQLDPSKVLLGKWEGEIGGLSRRSDPNRTLIIDSVAERDGKLVAEGRYGITGKGLGKVQINVDSSGSHPSIQFTTGANLPVRLNLIDEKSLVGTITLPGALQGANDRTMRLEKTH
jgi:hypothetical protein